MIKLLIVSSRTVLFTSAAGSLNSSPIQPLCLSIFHFQTMKSSVFFVLCMFAFDSLQDVLSAHKMLGRTTVSKSRDDRGRSLSQRTLATVEQALQLKARTPLRLDTQ